MNKIYNRLVATGDPDADAALRLSSTIHVLARDMERACRALISGRAEEEVPWPPAATKHNPVGYMPALQVTLIGLQVIEAIHEQTENLILEAHARDEWIADRVRVQMNREADPTFMPEEIRLYTTRDA